MKRMKKLFLGLLSLTLLMTSCSNNKEVKYVRKNANSIEAQSDVEALDNAMRIMKQRGCEDPTSWYYQSAIHWVPTRVKDNQLCESYTDWTELKIAWDECTHSHSGAEEINFLIWHRMYIWHLEKIVRETSGNKDFALPYWGYTNYNNSDKVMPKMWRDTTSSLYESDRLDSLNHGLPIMGATRRMLAGEYPKLMNITDYQTFNKNLDQSIHGGMHNYIGSGNAGVEEHYNIISQKSSTTGMMSDVATAAFDPIFWAHHSNIDRMFQQWLNSPNGQKVTLQQLEENPWKYEFFDEHGRLVNYTPAEVMAVIYNMDYDYDDTKVVENLKSGIAIIGEKEVISFVSPNLIFDGESMMVGSISKPTDYNHDKVLLEISTTFDEQPLGLYEIYINHPDGESFDVESASYIGSVSFFGANHGDPRNTQCYKGCCSPISEDGKLMTVFKFELNTEDVYDITIFSTEHNEKFGLKINKLALRNYEL